MAERRLAQGEKALARQFYERSVGLLRRLIAEFPNESSNRDRLRISLFRLSVLDLESGQLEQAERRSREVLSLGEDFDRRFPDLALLPPHMTALARFGSEHRDLARILEEQGRFQEAVDLYDKAIVILEDATRRQPRDRFAPRWLAEARRSRDAAIAKQRESAVARDSTATLSESRSLDDVMPNGKEAFRKE
jgi:tetratricopeptide (TPR) repeat protein